MEHRFKSFEQKKPRIYRFTDIKRTSDKKPQVIELVKLGRSAEYIAAELSVSHTWVLKVIRESKNEIHA